MDVSRHFPTHSVFTNVDKDVDADMDHREMDALPCNLCCVPIIHSFLLFFLWQLLIQRADVNESNDLTLAEFVNYVQEHEKRLLLVFHTLDANSDGRQPLSPSPPLTYIYVVFLYR